LGIVFALDDRREKRRQRAIVRDFFPIVVLLGLVDRPAVSTTAGKTSIVMDKAMMFQAWGCVALLIDVASPPAIFRRILRRQLPAPYANPIRNP